ncbi:MAG: hypothetical protein Q4P13_07845 [Psychrobacter sp.]|nr:hypothetical protein [Psychrobacter sp.]
MRLGYYAHHHGSGHCRQADKLAGLLSAQGFNPNELLTVFTSTPKEDYSFSHLQDSQVIRLPDEHEDPSDLLPGRAGSYWQPASMHYSPVGNSTIQLRSLMLIEQIAKRRIELMIIDLSVEVALLCRVSSIPYLYVRLPGERDDTPHLNAFAGAIGLLAAYPKCLEVSTTPDWVKQKTLYLGFLSSDSDSNSQSPLARFRQPLNKADFAKQLLGDFDELLADSFSKPAFNAPIITVIKGFGGHERIDDELDKLRQALPKALIISLGPIKDNAKQFVDIAIQVDDVTPFLQHSDVLIMACGLNSIAEACQSMTIATPLVVIPDERPHREQEMMADGLIASGRAIGFEAFLAQISLLGSDASSFSKLLAFKSNANLQAQLQASIAEDFITSIGDADSAKVWFYNWLLPRLELVPERRSD